MSAPRKNFDSAVAQYRTGKSVGEIAAIHGVARQAMWKILRRRIALRPQKRIGSDNTFYRHGKGYGDEKRRALVLVGKAIRRGQLHREPCEVCGSTARAKDGRSLVHAHHDDYNKPLEVRWLCQRCHFEHHEKTKSLLQ